MDRFLNLVYFEMTQAVEPGKDQPMEEAVADLNNHLGVVSWTPFRGQQARRDDRDPLAPAWWTDDEDASASFLSSVGMDLGKQG